MSTQKARVFSQILTFLKTNQKRIVIFILVLATIIRILLAVNIPIEINEAGFDDTLQFTQAENIREGHWLGNYNFLTLTKGISFPAFMALCNLLLIPYNLGLILLYIAAIVILCISLKPKISKKSLCILYLLLLFSPFMFANPVVQRLYRSNIMPAGTMLIFASYIGIFLRRNQSIKKLIPWCLLSVVSIIFFWHIKEDSIWVLPFIGTISLICIIYWLVTKRPRLILTCLIPIIPFISLFGFNSIYRAINQNVYGIYTISDRSSGNFAAMASSLLSIEDSEKSDSRIWVSQKMLDKAAKASPTFNSIKKDLDKYPGWTDPNKEVRGDWIIWKIRTVMANLGYYETPQKASDFCRKVTEELQEAYQNGTLEKDHRLHLSPQMRGLILGEDLPVMLSSQFDWFISFSNYQGIQTTNTAGTADLNLAIRVQNFTNSPTVFPGTNYPNQAVVYANKITKLYRALAPIVTCLSIIAFVGMIIYIVYQMVKKNFADVDIITVLIGIALSFIMVLSEIIVFIASFYGDGTEGHPADIFYSAGVLPLIQLFKYLPLFYICERFSPIVRAKIKSKTKKRKR